MPSGQDMSQHFNNNKSEYSMVGVRTQDLKLRPPKFTGKKGENVRQFLQFNNDNEHNVRHENQNFRQPYYQQRPHSFHAPQWNNYSRNATYSRWNNSFPKWNNFGRDNNYSRNNQTIEQRQTPPMNRREFHQNGNSRSYSNTNAMNDRRASVSTNQEIEETNKIIQPIKMEPISQHNVASQTDLMGQATCLASSIDEYYSCTQSVKSTTPTKRRIPFWVHALLTIVLVSTLWSCCNANYTETMPRLHPVYYCSVPREKGVSQFKSMQQCNQNCHVSPVQGLQHKIYSFRPKTSKG